jgi:DNA ligase-4
LFFLKDGDLDVVEGHVDGHGDAYARDIEDVDEVRRLLEGMQSPKKKTFDKQGFLNQLQGHGEEVTRLKSYMFVNAKVALKESDDAAWKLRSQIAANYIRFGGGEVVEGETARGVTHVIIPDENGAGSDGMMGLTSVARLVGVSWVERCWEEGTMLDEERFQWG